MKSQIIKYYYFQLFIACLYAVLAFIFIGEMKDFDTKAYLILAIYLFAVVLAYVLMNACINALNFTFPLLRNNLLAFYLPMMIWTIPLAIRISEIQERNTTDAIDWIIILAFLEPIAYNLLLRKVVNSQ